MKLHDFEVNVGDKVYDITTGRFYSVNEVGTTNFKIALPSGLNIAIDNQGRSAGRRRIYWSNPILIIPAKDGEGFLDKVRTLAEVIREW